VRIVKDLEVVKEAKEVKEVKEDERAAQCRVGGTGKADWSFANTGEEYHAGYQLVKSYAGNGRN